MTKSVSNQIPPHEVLDTRIFDARSEMVGPARDWAHSFKEQNKGVSPWRRHPKHRGVAEYRAYRSNEYDIVGALSELVTNVVRYAPGTEERVGHFGVALAVVPPEHFWDRALASRRRRMSDILLIVADEGSGPVEIPEARSEHKGHRVSPKWLIDKSRAFLSDGGEVPAQLDNSDRLLSDYGENGLGLKYAVAVGKVVGNVVSMDGSLFEADGMNATNVVFVQFGPKQRRIDQAA